MAEKATQAGLIGALMMTAELAGCFSAFCKERAAAMEADSTEAAFFTEYSNRAGKLAEAFNRVAQDHVATEKAASAGAAEPLESDSTHRELVSKAVSEVLNVLGATVIPDGIHGAIPMGVQAVPRFGAAAVGAGGGDRPNVRAEFQNLVRVD